MKATSFPGVPMRAHHFLHFPPSTRLPCQLKMTNTIAEARLREERRNWRRDHPHSFYARPKEKEDGNLDLMHWEAVRVVLCLNPLFWVFRCSSKLQEFLAQHKHFAVVPHT